MDYNTEDTGKLMTEGLGSRRRKRLILAVIAVIAVAAVAGIVGYRFYGDRQYNDQVAIAEKALSEGRYEEAEAAYLKAVNMRKRDVPARKGLAYTYALEGKFEDATREYDELYRITEEEVYRDASKDTSVEQMPGSEELIPEGIFWTEIPIENTPDPEGCTAFLNQYMTYFNYYYSLSDRRGGDTYECYDFDCNDPSVGYPLPLTYCMVKDDPEYGEIMEETGSGSDPRGWDEYSTGYQRENKKSTDAMCSAVFNLDEEGINTALESAENNQLMYLEDGYYYKVDPPMGLDAIETDIISCRSNGLKYCIEYSAGLYDLSYTEHIELGTFYAVMGRKNINGIDKWTLFYNGEQMPEYVRESTAKEKDGHKDGGNALFSQLEGVPFAFASGAGAWATALSIHADGSFEGYYHDSDMGDIGDGYPNGTRYESNFTGKFTAPQKVNDYTYEFRIESIATEKENGEEYIEDGVLIVCSEPYGLEDAEQLYLYLPDAPVSSLPEGYTSWLYGLTGEMPEEMPEGTLGGYGLYNAAQEEGFYGYIGE